MCEYVVSCVRWYLLYSFLLLVFSVDDYYFCFAAMRVGCYPRLPQPHTGEIYPSRLFLYFSSLFLLALLDILLDERTATGVWV